MQGERVVISDADVIEGWTRMNDGGWSAPVNSKPKKLFRDGQPCRDFTYDRSAHRIAVKGTDPRLHLFETVVRQKPVNLSATPKVRIINITEDKH